MGGSAALVDAPSCKRSDLIGEVRKELRRREIDLRRQQRREKFRRTCYAVAALLLLLASAGAVKAAADRDRIDDGLAQARALMMLGSPDELAMAAARLEQNLRLRPDDEGTLALLAMVRLHESVQAAAAPTRARALLEQIDEDASSPEIEVARASLAAIEGDAELAWAVAMAPRDAQDDLVAAQSAWIAGAIALRQIDRTDRSVPALERLQAVLAAEPGWTMVRSMAVAVATEMGRGEQAFELLDAGRERASSPDLAAAVDRALASVVHGIELDDANEALRALLARRELEPRAVGRAHLGRAIARVRKGDRSRAIEDLTTAWPAIPAWDWQTRALAMQWALRAGATERVETWLTDAVAEPGVESLLRAWLELAEAEPEAALRRLAELPQTHPRVAMLQALALVEQGRWAEADAWIVEAERRASASPQASASGSSPELAVARARVDARLGRRDDALLRLQAIAERDPSAPRVWTALGEVHGLATDDASAILAREALTEAIEREPSPAHAHWLLGAVAWRDAANKPSSTLAALDHLRRATALAEGSSRYRASLGIALADAGDSEAADEALRAAIAAEAPDAKAVLRMVALELDKSRLRGGALPSDVDAWLELAARSGASSAELERARAAVALHRGGESERADAIARLRTVLAADPKDVSARVLLAEGLLAAGEVDAARETLQAGVRKVRRQEHGRLYLAWAETERARGKKRRAASLAFKGWRMMVVEGRPASELLAVANEVADLWFDLRQPRGARAVARDLIDRVPWSGRAWALRAQVQLEADYVESACESAQKAVELEPELAAAYQALGDCKLHTLRFEAARSAYEKAIALHDGTADERLMQRRLRRLG